MVPGSNETPENAVSSTNVVERTDDKNRTPRHPRWTREETRVLIEGKNLAEERGRRGRRSSSVFGPDQVEPKWDSVSSHCRRFGVNRGPVQCRKRWSNLVSDFKKIKKWESERESESFWMMRSDLRREKKLPGFFDREVFDVLDGKEFARGAYELAVVAARVDEKKGECFDGLEAEEEDEKMVDDEETGDGSFSEFEQVAEKEIGISPGKGKVQTDGEPETIPSPVPISEMKYHPFYQADSGQGTRKKRQPDPHFGRGSEFEDGAKKRKQSSSDCENIDVDDLLIKALERNANLLNAQLEDQKLNYQLDREQKKEQHDSLVTALTKITNALAKIADKL